MIAALSGAEISDLGVQTYATSKISSDLASLGSLAARARRWAAGVADLPISFRFLGGGVIWGVSLVKDSQKKSPSGTKKGGATERPIAQFEG